MNIHGKKIRDRIQHELVEVVKGRTQPIKLAIIIVGKNPVIEGFVAIKKRFAETIGVEVMEERFPEDVSTQEVADVLRALAENDQVSGIVVQLPLPVHIDTQAILNRIPVAKDVDVLSQAAVDLFTQGELPVLPPVVGAIAEVLSEIGISVKSLKTLVVGHGRLVGAPVAKWLTQQGAQVTVLDRSSEDLRNHAQDSEIIITGAGVPGLITEDMVTSSSILIDAGTSESSGRIVGDIHEKALTKACFATPVPGGVGPVTVAILFRNLIILSGKDELK